MVPRLVLIIGPKPSWAEGQLRAEWQYRSSKSKPSLLGTDLKYDCEPWAFEAFEQAKQEAVGEFAAIVVHFATSPNGSIGAAKDLISRIGRRFPGVSIIALGESGLRSGLASAKLVQTEATAVSLFRVLTATIQESGQGGCL